MNVPGGGAAKRLVLEVVGWVMLVVGIAALFLPGPGLLLMFGGLAVLSQQYDWAARWVDPVRLRALRGAAEGVETWPRILMSSMLAVALVGFGVLWVVGPAAPDWWPVSDTWWLPGGAWTGVTQIVSGIIAGLLIVYSYRRFHDNPAAVAALEGDIDDADDDLPWHEDEDAEGGGLSGTR